MDTHNEIDGLVERLVQNPHDQEAIASAHAHGQADPSVYARLLERVGEATPDPSLASHWFTEAANVWEASLQDRHQAARALMSAIDRDPTDSLPAERLAQLYRGEGDVRALTALLERRARNLAPLVRADPELRETLVAIHEELGRLWEGPPLSKVDKALENYEKALEHNPKSHFAIYAMRELLKAAGRYGEAIPYFDMERVLSNDPERRLALYVDEVSVCFAAGEEDRAVEALKMGLGLDPSHPDLRQQLATVLLEHVRSGRAVAPAQRREGADLFIGLAEEYSEHGLEYSLCALELDAGHDRAMQLAHHFGRELGRLPEVAAFASAYVRSNPGGALVVEARAIASTDDEPLERGQVPALEGRGGEAGAVMEPPVAESAAVAQEPSHSGAMGEAPVDAEVSDTEPPAESVRPEAEPSAAPAPEQQPAAVAEGPVGELQAEASELIRKNRRNEAAQKYKELLELEPANPVAVEYLQTFLRRTRRFKELRACLSAAARVEGVTFQQRASWLREVASLSEGQLQDLEGALSAWRSLADLGAGDESVNQLRRLLERAGRWPEVAELLRSQADQQSDLESRIAIEKDLSRLQQTKLGDPVAAGEAWARIAGLAPGDEVAIDTAVKLFESAERYDLAIRVVTENIQGVEDPTAKVELLTRLGTLRLDSGDASAAAQAYSEAAQISHDSDLWELTETSYLQAKQLDQAVKANAERVRLLEGQPTRQAALLLKASEYLVDAGEQERALKTLFEATALDPENDGYAEQVEKLLLASRRSNELPTYLLERAGRVQDATNRVKLRKRAARFQSHELGDFDAARLSYELVVQESDDEEALSLLADDAEGRGDAASAVGYLQRLIALREESKRVPLLLREAYLRHANLKDLDGAVASYERVLKELDPKNRDALAALADLELMRGRPERAAEALERQLELAEQPADTTELGSRLADLYETELDDVDGALRVLQIVQAADPTDFEAVQRICDLSERSENWGLLARHLDVLIRNEEDEEEISAMTRRLAAVLHERLERSDEALRYLEGIADRGDEGCRQQFISLADDLSKPVVAADKLVEWYAPEMGSPRRAHALHGAFTRLVTANEEQKVLAVARELARTRSADVDIAEPMERVATKLGDLDVLNVALELKVRDLIGVDRAEEMIRQAEVLVRAGLEPSQATIHGERALASVAPDRVEPLLARLASLTTNVEHRVDVYERQIDRCKGPEERLKAASRAAQVASEQGDLKRARHFFDLALSDGAAEASIEVLEKAARASDAARGNRDTTLRVVLAEALAAGGQEAAVSAAHRADLLCRAAQIAHRDLAAHEKAFSWLSEALVTHVSNRILDNLNELALDLGEHERAEKVLSTALEEVFDMSSVRQLLHARSMVRRSHLSDPAGAADDLKRLHELAPGDEQVLQKLEALYRDLGDHHGLVQLYENQILRGRDPNARAELARRVALLWRDQLKDPRETADAWRRVLRMKPGDREAKEGLAVAKKAMPYRRTPVAGRSKSSRPPVAPAEVSGRITEESAIALKPSAMSSAASSSLGGRAIETAAAVDTPRVSSSDDDEEVRDEDLALDDEEEPNLDDDLDAAFAAAQVPPSEDGNLDVEVEMDFEGDDEPVTTIDEGGLLQTADGSGGHLRPPPLNSAASGPAKRKRSRKRSRTTADTGIHRKPNVSRRSKKH